MGTVPARRCAHVTSTGPAEHRPAEVALVGVTAEQAARVRRQVTRAAERAGATSDATATFAVAVNEVVINAVLHGGGTADVTIAAGPGGVLVEVRDHGPGLPPQRHGQLPPADQPGGRGLWLVEHLCPDAVFDSGPAGTTVRLRLSTSRS
jgi:serine/threonine-protein kinase RsbW